MRVVRGLLATVPVMLTGAMRPALAAPSLMSSESTHPGIEHEVWVDPAMPARIHVIRIDLTSQEISLFTTKESEKGRTTSAYSQLVGAAVAINGDSFAVSGFRPRGLAMGDGAIWSNTADDGSSAVFHLRRSADGQFERTLAEILTPEATTTATDLPPDTRGVISGRPLLIRAANVETGFPDDPITIAYQRAPRTAIAVSEDGNRMWLVTVDGWQAGSIGMTAAELATFLRTTINPYMAMALDGGGSSTLVVDGVTANSPSDGVQRSVANHLAVKFGPLTGGELIGLICKNTLVGCGDNPAQQLPGAEATLDDGRVFMTGSDAKYSFKGISPRIACVTARMDGFKTNTLCHKVVSGTFQFNSIPLEPGEDPPDAGPFDAGVPIDATDPGDAGLRPDAQDPGLVDGGGCCDSRSRPTGGLIVVGFVAFVLRRRRRS
jgi:hypothetical protein